MLYKLAEVINKAESRRKVEWDPYPSRQVIPPASIREKLADWLGVRLGATAIGVALAKYLPLFL